MSKMVVIAMALVSIGIGAAAGAMMGGKAKQAAPAPASASASDQAPAEEHGGGHGESSEHSAGGASEGNEHFSYIKMEQITVNLNEPRLARYMRAVVHIVVRKEDTAAATKAIEGHMPELKSRLLVFFSGCTLDDVRGPDSLERIKREVHTLLNTALWPDGRPLIDHVVLSEFSVQ